MYRLLFFIITALIIGVGLACEEDTPPRLPDIVWEGEKIRYGTTDNILPPAGTFARFEKVVSDIEIELGVSIPEGKKIDYYYLGAYIDDWREFCKSGHEKVIPGCTKYDGRVFSFYEDTISVHELIHAVMFITIGTSHSLLSEGFAVYFSDRSFFLDDDENDSAQDRIDRIENAMFANAVSADVDYESAGYFVGYLINEYGLEATLELYRQATQSSTKQDLNRILVELTGDSLETIFSNMVADMPQCHVEYVGYYSDLVPWNEKQWHYIYEISYDSNDVYADDIVSFHDGFLTVSSLFEIESDGGYLVTITMSPLDIGYTEPYITRCNEIYITSEGAYSAFIVNDERINWDIVGDEITDTYLFTFAVGTYELMIPISYYPDINDFFSASDFVEVTIVKTE
ncbi:MAG: hypothetical protein JXX29_19535 [Deltaproteobacteria bacterium]|nr:hypothetical protein [Deltaproteobacteria bacterium]